MSAEIATAGTEITRLVGRRAAGQTNGGKMPLTVKEKEHWKQRIEKKIDKAIEKVHRDEGKTLRQTIRQEAEARVLKRLGLENYMKQHKKLKTQKSELDQQQSELSEEAA